MCTIICTMRTVLWYVMSIVGTLLILVALFTDKWLDGKLAPSNFGNVDAALDTAATFGQNLVESVKDGVNGEGIEAPGWSIGLFRKCAEINDHEKFFEGECIPDINYLKGLFTEFKDDVYPHAWRGAVLCFAFGEALMVITVFFGLLTVCCRRCICCSVFTICGSIQSFAGILFTLGCIAYPAGWGSNLVKNEYCAGQSGPFNLGQCTIGIGFWLAVAGTVCTVLASSLAIWAYQSTRSSKAEEAQDQGEHCICLV